MVRGRGRQSNVLVEAIFATPQSCSGTLLRGIDREVADRRVRQNGQHEGDARRSITVAAGGLVEVVTASTKQNGTQTEEGIERVGTWTGQSFVSQWVPVSSHKPNIRAGPPLSR